MREHRAYHEYEAGWVPVYATPVGGKRRRRYSVALRALVAVAATAIALSLLSCAVRTNKTEGRVSTIIEGWGLSVRADATGPQYILISAPPGVVIRPEEWRVEIGPAVNGQSTIRLLRVPEYP